MIKKNVIRRTFKSKKNPEAPQRHKAPKIQRLITDQRLRRKRVVRQETVNRWKRTQEATTEYQKLYDAWIKKKSYDFAQARRAERLAKEQPKEEKKPEPKKVEAKKEDPKKAAQKKVDPKKAPVVADNKKPAAKKQ